MQLWLFDGPAVTWEEVFDWTESVTGIRRDSPRARYYIEHWNVAEKIGHVKRAMLLSYDLHRRPRATTTAPLDEPAGSSL